MWQRIIKRFGRRRNVQGGVVLMGGIWKQHQDYEYKLGPWKYRERVWIQK